MTDIECARALYRALNAADGPALVRLLSPRFSGEVSRGMPADLGGHVEGPGGMLAVWSAAARLTPLRPRPDELVTLPDGRVLALGRYVGGGHEAAFAHVLSFDGEQLVGLVQITDTAIWQRAAGSAS